MPWLRYSDDEVLSFHPAFEASVNAVLNGMGVQARYELRHHHRTLGVQTIPDFVLVDRDNHDAWVMAIEIKRTSSAVFSARFQGQAKGYAESNQDRYRPGSPKYFMLTNLETTLLFSLNGEQPASGCLLQNGSFRSGQFVAGTAATHRAQFAVDLRTIISLVSSTAVPIFDMVWPSFVATWMQFSNHITANQNMIIAGPASPNWDIVRDYFCDTNHNAEASRIFLLRCLMIEYLRGLLLRHNHPLAQTIPPLRANVSIVANAIEALRRIDFACVFEEYAANVYRNLLAQDGARVQLNQYIESLLQNNSRMVETAMRRVDAPSLLDELFESLNPGVTADLFGKVQTDPELASILAWLTIINNNVRVIDPCCGDGSLLSAAYDRLSSMGASPTDCLLQLAGIEVDPILLRLASIRLAIKQPASLIPEANANLQHGDVFYHSDMISEYDVIVMNPPFKRYEAQDERPIPQELRQHFSNAIQEIDGQSSIITNGQPNIFNYYVEYVGKAARPGAILGIILDNRWYHNQYGAVLREYILRYFDILCIIEYPHTAFFSNNTIATTITILRKRIEPNNEHQVQFVRCQVDPRSANQEAITQALHNHHEWPVDWSCNTVLQRELTSVEGWKNHFQLPVQDILGLNMLQRMGDLFGNIRRGRLDAEEGGVSSLGFPFSNSPFKNRRCQLTHERSNRAFATGSERELTPLEKRNLVNAARQIPDDYRGYAIKNSDDVGNYTLTIDDVTVSQTIEPPRLRSRPELFQGERSSWAEEHEAALTEMRAHPQVGQFIRLFEETVNLRPPVLPYERVWVVLREPFAGGLLIPRKLRGGHRVHVNPFAFRNNGRQIRISSNFISYGNCHSVDPESGLNEEVGTRLIAAFLVSSFGQLQFELNGTNREGCCSVEKEGLNNIRVVDPRRVRPERRQDILDCFDQLHYPVRTSHLSTAQPERNALDQLWAEEMVAANPLLNTEQIIDTVHRMLDEFLIARQP